MCNSKLFTTKQVYVADPGCLLGRAGIPKHAIITQLAGVATPSLSAFAARLAALQPDTYVPLQYFRLNERHRHQTGLLYVDYKWCASGHYCPMLVVSMCC